MKINLIDFGEEFCTKRTSTTIPKLKKLIVECMNNNEVLEINTEKVKLIGPSFVDEILPSLIIQYGADRILKSVKFAPELQGYSKDQIAIGVKNRISRQGS